MVITCRRCRTSEPGEYMYVVSSHYEGDDFWEGVHTVSDFCPDCYDSFLAWREKEEK